MPPKVDEFGLKILFLLIPGIIALGIVKSTGPKRPRTDFESGLQIFMYGVVCYAIAGSVEGIYSWKCSPSGKGFWETIAGSSLGLATLNPEVGLGAGHIVFATFVAIVLGLAVGKIQTHSIPHRIMHFLRLTQRTSEFDIWQFTLNSPDIDSWVTVRHHDNGKVYQGWVRAYSDGGDERELLLANVRVYAPSGDNGDLEAVDEIPVLYLGLDRKNAILEFTSLT
jgi:Family of unknown function (DUF6338)